MSVDTPWRMETFNMAKETNMKSIETEVKSIAKAVGASLKRSGHDVPHSVVLHALAAALDKRDWHKLKASLTGLEPVAPAVVPQNMRASEYSGETLHMLRLAYALGRPLASVPDDDFAALEAAQAAVGPIEGTFTLKGQTFPVKLYPQSWYIYDDAEAFKALRGIAPDSDATFSFKQPLGIEKLKVRDSMRTGWFLANDAQYALVRHLEQLVPVEKLFPQEKPALSPFALMMLRLAFVTGHPVYPVPDNETDAVAKAVEAVGNSIVGTLTFKNLSSPATLLGETGSFLVASEELNDRGVGQLSFATFEFETESYGRFTAAARYTWTSGWALDNQYLAPFQQALEAAVPYDVLSGAKPVKVAKASPQGPRVRARFWTDDHRFEVDFDATPYFEKSSADTLLSIAEVGFSGDYSTDNVAEYIADHKLCEELEDGFDYLHALQKASLRDPVGFECRVNSDDFYRWMDVHYRSELAQWLCVRAGVELTQYAGELDWLHGMWDWRAMDGRTNGQSLINQEEAALDAYHKLGLLKAALNGEL